MMKSTFSGRHEAFTLLPVGSPVILLAPENNSGRKDNLHSVWQRQEGYTGWGTTLS